MSAIKSKLPVVARILLGLIFTVFGLNGFLHFLPQPPLPGPAGAFIGALFSSGYLMQVVKALEIVTGVLLLAGRFVPLSLTLLAPIVVNIALFHAVMAPAGLGLVVLVVVLEGYLAWAYRDAFAPMLRADARPRSGETAATPAL